MSFQEGILTVKKKKMAIGMCFHPACAESKIYNAVMNSLPKKKGLLSIKKRMEAAYDLVQAMEKNGLKISV